MGEPSGIASEIAIKSWINRKKFKISRHAMMMASDQDNKDILETECPYGEAVEIKNRAKTRPKKGQGPSAPQGPPGEPMRATGGSQVGHGAH